MPPRKDLTGEKHGYLVVLGLSENKYTIPATGKTELLWTVQCTRCGKTKEMTRGAFKRCVTCGCATPTRKYHNCVICGKPFVFHPSDTKQCCSAKCAAQLRKQHGLSTPKGKKLPDAAYEAQDASPIVQKKRADFGKIGTAAALALPEGQRGPQNRTAKHWVLVDPLGNYYTAISLADWARKNCRLFFPEDVPEEIAARRIRCGFVAIASSMRGVPSRKRPVARYKGWHLAGLPYEKSEEDDFFDNSIK